MIAFWPKRTSPYARLRRRILRETEVALELGLSESFVGVRIPTVIVGQGQFDSAFAEAFWQKVFEDSGKVA